LNAPEGIDDDVVDRAAHEALLQFLYMAPIGLVQIAADGAIGMMNPLAVSLMMPLVAGARLDNLYDALHETAPQLRVLAAAFAGAHGPVCDVVRIPLPGPPAGMPPTRTVALSLFKLDARTFMAVLRDVTSELALERLEREASARVDSLTEMLNRTGLRERLQAGLGRGDEARGRHGAVLFINLDRFRQINDGLGHAAGDEVLALLADRLRATLRQGLRTGAEAAREPIVARLGGDEFAVVLDDLSREADVAIVAERILSVMGRSFAVRGHRLQCSLSMGIVLRTQFAGDADAVLQDASIAMVEAKRSGGGRFVAFKPEMRDRAARRQDLEQDLRRALAEGQLFVVYQPVVGFRPDGCSVDSSVGVEALVRWRHPQRGIVPPLDFIGLAEECGLIGELGHQVLDAACRQFVAWRDSLGPRAPRSLAVNLSRGQLELPSIAASVAAVLRASGMRAQDLQLEITESLAAQDENVQARLSELKALGVTLALDDFGTGYSSLSSLHLLPVDTVKIDRSFVSDAVTSAHHRVLVEATVRVARSLGMSTVAEGIETAEQSALICSLGCDKGQGYHFSRPLPADELAAWARLR
jgi:diguanylate cyclase (GGDEF)-like protein